MLVVEPVLGVLLLPRPDQSLMARREESSAEVGRGIGFIPADVVQHVVAIQLQREPASVDGMISATNPDAAVWFEGWLAGVNPKLMKFKVILDASGFVPLAFIHGHAAAGVAGECAGGEITDEKQNHIFIGVWRPINL